MRRILTSLLIGAAVAACGSARADNFIWRNSGSDMSIAANYLTTSGAVQTTAPGSGDVIWFTKPAQVQPHLSRSMTFKSLYFSVYPANEQNQSAAIRGEQNCSGYVIGGEAGCTLTLTATGGDPRAINGYTLGTNVVDVPLILSGNAPQVGGTGHTLVFNQPIAMDGSPLSRDISVTTGTLTNSQPSMCIFATENPNFRPKRIGFSWGSRIGVAHPKALAGVPELCSTGWGGSDNPTLENLCDEPLVMDDVVKWSEGWQQGYGGLQKLTVVGRHPIVMTNCVWALGQRDYKGRYINTALSVKNIGFSASDSGGFVKCGTDMFETLGDYQESGGTTHILVADGMFYPHKLSGTGGIFRKDRKFMLTGGTNSKDDNLLEYPTLGVDQDVTIEVNFMNGLFFGERDGNNQRAGGFSGMGGERKVRLVDPNSKALLSLVRGEKTSYTDSSGNRKGFIAPHRWVFGNKSATGTAVLVNDCTLANASDSKSAAYEVWAIQGKSDVAGRFAGTVTIFPGSNTCSFKKKGDGVLSFEKPIAGLSKPSSVEAGGLLLNANFNISGIEWTVKTNAWIGGKGQSNAITVNGGGAVSGGEFGAGEFQPTSVALEPGAGMLVNFRGGTAGCIVAKGTGAFTAGGQNFIRVDVEEGAPIQGKAKILDWTGYTGSLATSTMFDLDNYEIIYDKERITSLTVVEQDGAIWINYMCAAPGFKVMVR